MNVLIFLWAIAAFTLAIWLAVVLIISHGYRQMHHLGEVGKPRAGGPPLPRVSIIVTARNEERKVEQALRSLLNLDYPNYEVVFVNDRSDDRTGEIVERLRAENDRITLLDVSELPAGWFGKNHAAWRGSEAASGELLLFTDGDVVFEPNALGSGVSYFLRQELDHLCGAPLLRVSGIMLQTCLVAFVLLFFMMRPWRVRDPGSSVCLGIGAYNMMRADAYRAIGGHKRIALRPDEDIQLGKLAKRSGLRSDVAIGDKVVSVEWFSSVKDLIRGGEKNAFANAEYRVSALVGSSVFFFWLIWSPFVLAPALALIPVAGLLPPVLMLTVAAGLCWILSVRIAHTSEYPWWCGLLSPLGALIMVYMMWRSMFVNLSRGVAWGGPPIPLSVLRSNRIRAPSARERGRHPG